MRTVLDALRQVPDPRSRRGRVYPLHGILAVLLLAAMHGETSLRGMWQWGKRRARRLVGYEPLGLWGSGYPGLSTVWTVLQRLDAEALVAALRPFLPQEEHVMIDGKVLRGSKRAAGEKALHVLTMAGQQLGVVCAQRRLEGEDELSAALAMLEEMPVEGKVVSVDAGILKAAFAQKVVEKGGAISDSSRRISRA